MDIIWTKEELIKIKPILKKFDLKLDNNGNIVNGVGNDPEYIIRFVYHSEKKDLENLLFYTNKEDILKTLKLTIGVKHLVAKYPKHPIFNGLISSLAKIDPTDATEIFTIFIEILSLYKRTINNFAANIVNNLNDPYLVKEKIEEIKNSSEETIEEKKIKEYIIKILKLTNGINESKIFKPMIEKYNSNIKKLLLEDLNKRLIILIKKIEYKNIKDHNEHLNNFIIKLRKEKRTYGNDFMDK